MYPRSDHVAVKVTLTCDNTDTYPDCATRIITLETNKAITVGRASSNKSKGLHAAENNTYFNCPVISRHHAKLSLSDGNVILTDTGSTHGTFVNSRKVAHHEDYPLTSGDTLGFGETRGTGPRTGLSVIARFNKPSTGDQMRFQRQKRAGTYGLDFDDALQESSPDLSVEDLSDSGDEAEITNAQHAIANSSQDPIDYIDTKFNLDYSPNHIHGTAAKHAWPLVADVVDAARSADQTTVGRQHSLASSYTPPTTNMNAKQNFTEVEVDLDYDGFSDPDLDEESQCSEKSGGENDDASVLQQIHTDASQKPAAAIETTKLTTAEAKIPTATQSTSTTYPLHGTHVARGQGYMAPSNSQFAPSQALPPVKHTDNFEPFFGAPRRPDLPEVDWAGADSLYPVRHYHSPTPAMPTDWYQDFTVADTIAPIPAIIERDSQVDGRHYNPQKPLDDLRAQPTQKHPKEVERLYVPEGQAKSGDNLTHLPNSCREWRKQKDEEKKRAKTMTDNKISSSVKDGIAIADLVHNEPTVDHERAVNQEVVNSKNKKRKADAIESVNTQSGPVRPSEPDSATASPGAFEQVQEVAAPVATPADPPRPAKIARTDSLAVAALSFFGGCVATVGFLMSPLADSLVQA